MERLHSGAATAAQNSSAERFAFGWLTLFVTAELRRSHSGHMLLQQADVLHLVTMPLYPCNRSFILAGILAGILPCLPIGHAFAQDPNAALGSSTGGGRVDFLQGKFPTAPKGSDSLLVRGENEGQIPLVEIGAGVDRFPVKDVVEILDTSTPGVLTYTPAARINAGEPRQPFIEFRRVGGTAATSDTSVHKAKSITYLWDPLLSPDKKALALKVGWPYEDGLIYQIVIWDLVNGTLNRVKLPKYIEYPYLNWSQDSRNLCFILGGDSLGLSRSSTDSLELKVFELRTGTVRTVATNVTALPILPFLGPAQWMPGTSVSWSNDNTILYVKGNPQPRPIPQATKLTPFPYDVYEVSSTGEGQRLLLQRAINPVSSPNGKLVAVYGPSAASSAEKVPSEGAEKTDPLVLSIFDRAKGSRTEMKGVGFGRVSWLPDNRHLVVLVTKPENSGSRGEIYLVDSSTGSAKLITTLHAKDFQGMKRAMRHYRILDVSGAAVALSVSELTGPDRAGYSEKRTLRVVELNSGEVTDVAVAQNVDGENIGWDWRFLQ